VKRFLWRFFQNGLDALMIVFSMRAAKTKTPWDDEIVRLAESIGDKFIPGQVSADGKAWIDLPAITLSDKGKVVRAVGAIVMKELLLNQDFRREARLDDMQADRLLIASLTFLKPEAVDTPEEIQAILDTIKPEI